jgi:hypothetical protein
MPGSSIYLQIKRFIEKDWIISNPAEVVNQLQLLKEEKQITDDEFKSLIELYQDRYKNAFTSFCGAVATAGFLLASALA